MDAPAAPSAEELTYAVDFDAARTLDGQRNLDFRGSGTLTIISSIGRVRFVGRPRRALAFGSKVLSFSASELWNVALADRDISFATGKGESGGYGAQFVFRARTAEEAAAIVAQLPKAVAADFTELQDFAAKVHALPAPRTWWSSVTTVILALNIGAFLALALFADAGWLTTNSLLPYVRFGANNAAATTDGEWWRLLTSMFMHYGALHLFMNMWALYQTGHMVEKLFGRSLFALGYLGSGLVGGFASMVWHGDKVWSAGASGAVFGVYGLLLGYIRREKLALPKRVYQPMMNSTLAFAGYNLVYGLMLPQIDNAAHAGGLLGGIVLGWLMARPLDHAPRARLFHPRLVAGLVALAAAVGIGVVAAPRFNYRVTEELAWDDFAEEFDPAERQLLKRERELRAQYQIQHNNRDAFATFLDAELLPFYDRWRLALQKVPATAGTTTARKIQAVGTVLEQRAASYRALAEGVRRDDPAALGAFDHALREISRRSQSRPPD